MKDDNVPNNTNGFDHTIQEIRDLYYQSVSSRQFNTGAEKIKIDSEWTNLFQRLTVYGNTAVLNGFKLRLEMDEENEREEIHQR
jgi:hypothetical protein